MSSFPSFSPIQYIFVFYWNKISLDAIFYRFESHQVFRGAFDLFLSLGAMVFLLLLFKHYLSISLCKWFASMYFKGWKRNSEFCLCFWLAGLSFSFINNVNDYCCCSWCRYVSKTGVRNWIRFVCFRFDQVNGMNILLAVSQLLTSIY